MKNEIRQIIKQKRSLMSKDEAYEKSKKASFLFLESELYKNSEEIMLYMPLGNETSTTTIINQAYKDGKKVIFPITDAKSGEITPCYADETSVFVKGAFSVSEPEKLIVPDLNDIDTVIVPGVAFDRTGARIGFGKGCYDKFLSKLSVTKIGFCYDFQIAENIKTDKHDITMDYIVTEKEIIICTN